MMGGSISEVLCREQLCELRERCYMSIREAHEPLHHCSRQSAHEQLASRHIRAPNQHHLCMEGRKVGLRVFHPGEGHFGPNERGWYHCINNLCRERCWELGGVTGP